MTRKATTRSRRVRARMALLCLTYTEAATQVDLITQLATAYWISWVDAEHDFNLGRISAADLQDDEDDDATDGYGSGYDEYFGDEFDEVRDVGCRECGAGSGGNPYGECECHDGDELPAQRDPEPELDPIDWDEDPVFHRVEPDEPEDYHEEDPDPGPVEPEGEYEDAFADAG